MEKIEKNTEEDWKKDFGEKLVSEEMSCYFTHKGDIFSLDWLLDFIESEKRKSYEEGYNRGLEDGKYIAKTPKGGDAEAIRNIGNTLDLISDESDF
jgi:flagellar biosynthesis/type III secretory pathway protein FliH